MATRQEILSQLADDHEKRISKVLFDLEDDIIAELESATRQVSLNTNLAIQLRPNLKRLIEENYLKEGTRIVSDYDKVVKEYQDYIKRTPIADKFKTLTKPDLAIINQLKQLSFSGFQDVANRFLDEISTEVYKSAIVGKPFPDMVRTIRGQINGVYQRSNEEAINRLVRVVEENKYSSDPAAIKKTQDATKILQTKYAADRVGNNMKKYASQIAHDSLMQFDGQFTKYKAQEAGLTQFKYVGTNITTTREFCRNQLDKVFTEEEAREVWSQSWKGKSGGDPFVDRGGYRCRHSFIPYDTAWDNIPEVQDKVKPVATTIKKTEDVPTNVSSLANPIKLEDINPVTGSYITNKLSKQFRDNDKDPRYVKYDNGGSATKFSGSSQQIGKLVFDNDFDEKDFGIIEALFQELDDLAVKYDVPKLRGINTAPGVVANMGDGILGLNSKYNHLPNVSRDFSKWKFGDSPGLRPFTADSYFTDKLDKLRTTFYHEFAHHIHQQKFNKSYADYLIPTIEKKLKGKRIKNRGSTRYSDKNPKEWFAENFCLYEMGKTELVDPRFIEFLKENVL